MEEQEHGTATLAESALGAGTANTSEPEFIKYLEQTNAAPEVIAEARKSTMLHRDYTQKRQQESAEIQQIRAAYATQQQQLAYLQGQMQAGGGGRPMTPTEHVLSKIEAQGEEGLAAAAQLREMLAAHESEVLQKVYAQIGPIVQPAQQAAMEMQVERIVDTLYDEQILPEYGEAAKAIWPALRKDTLKRLRAGDPVAKTAGPLGVLVTYYPNDALALKEKQNQTRQRQSQERALEGTQRIHRMPTPALPGGQSSTDKRPLTATEMVKNVMADFKRQHPNSKAFG